MKTIILIAVFIFLILMSAFPQQNSHFIQDSSGNDKLVLPKQIFSEIGSAMIHADTSMDSILKHFSPPDPRQLKILTPHEFNKLPGVAGHGNTIDNMSCYNPKGNFPMPVVRPGSARHYTLLIK